MSVIADASSESPEAHEHEHELRLVQIHYDDSSGRSTNEFACRHCGEVWFQ